MCAEFVMAESDVVVEVVNLSQSLFQMVDLVSVVALYSLEG